MKRILFAAVTFALAMACSKEPQAPHGAMTPDAESTLLELRQMSYSFIEHVRAYKGDVDHLADALTRRNFKVAYQELKISAAQQSHWQQILDQFPKTESTHPPVQGRLKMDWKQIITSIQTQPQWETFNPSSRAPVCSRAYYTAVNSCADNPNFFMACLINAYCTHCTGEGTAVLCGTITN